MEKISLNGKWNLSNSKYDIDIETEVPGTVFEALINHNIIQDPFYGLNEHKVKWVYESEWVYSTKFDVGENFLKYSKITLKFHGLDTVSKIFLNGALLGHTDNVFITYEYNVKEILKNRSNSLKIEFKSPITTIEELLEKFKVKLRNFHSYPGVPYLRKAQYSFGWDWAPNLPDIGIWRSIDLIGYNEVKIKSIYTEQNFEYRNNVINRVILQVQVEFNIEKEELLSDFVVKLMLKAPNKIHLNQVRVLTNKIEQFKFDIVEPMLWWTHDIGIPHLYDLVIQLKKNNSMIDSRHLKIGLRDIKLIRNKDQWGESFYFQLNRIPLFAKGANWIPIDSFIPRGKKKNLYENLLSSTKAAEMNMLRVWGGGIYESDLFYDLCDKLGILVWQDFMFSGALIPTNQDFFNNIKKEAKQNIIRLRNHPCLALWCGNNEIEQLWLRDVELAEITEKRIIKTHEKAYLDIFKNLLPSLIEKYDKNNQYWPSSALDQFAYKKEISLTGNDPNSGDCHLWKVWDLGLFTPFDKTWPRFVSEFGFESLPSIKTIQTFCPEDQLNINSLIMKNHQKNDFGNEKIIRYMKRRLGFSEHFENQIILSQINQAEAIEYGVRKWRQNRNQFQCMGSLFWQLNDCWPVISWSSIDYYGRWKALHYFARRFYSALYPSIEINKKEFNIWITNDLRTSTEFIINWRIYNSESDLLKKGIIETKIAPCFSKVLAAVDITELTESKEKRRNLIIFYDLKPKTGQDYYSFQGFTLFDHPKYFNLREPDLSWDIKEIKPDELKLIIKSKKIALYVFFDSEYIDFVASDNFFSMEPKETKIVDLKDLKYVNSKHLSNNQLYNSIKVKSLYDLI